MKKKIILIIAVILIIFGAYQIFIKKEAPDFTLEKVSRGTILQEVSETGTVKTGEEISLSFESGGRIEKIYVETGDEVKSGQVLAKLETDKLAIQLIEAQASLGVAQAQLKVASTSVSNNQIALSTAEQNLNDVIIDAAGDLNNAYGDSLNTLDDAYLKTYAASEKVKTIYLSYFTKLDQESITVREQKDKIEVSLSQIKSDLDEAKANPTNENIDEALSETKKSLGNVADSLTIIRQTCEVLPYRDEVSSTDKTALDTQRTNINTALTNITNTMQTIAATKITNNTNINAAQNAVLTAQGNLKKSQEDINLYAAQITQAQANVDLIKKQITDASIFAPTSGEITDVNKQTSETVQATESVFSFISAGPFQIEADIYEEDVVKVKVGNSVDIKLTAFPGQKFLGNVISINPAEKLINDVVYYEITIGFESAPEGVKPGMTADISIITAQKDNVLIISRAALAEKDGKTTVQIATGKTTETREIQTGLEGSNDMVEVISGLQEGETIAIPK